MNNIRQLTIQEINQKLDLDLPDNVAEEEIIQLLAKKIVQFLDKGPEPFFQLMYRIDIPEGLLNEAIKSANPAESIAHLIYRRQLQKMQSRIKYSRKDKRDNDPELNW